MDFDRFTIGLLILRTDAPKLSEEEENALQDAHMAHLAKLHDEGILLAAGPLLGSSDRDLRGLEIYKGTPEQVKPTADRDPGVRAGRYTHRFIPWMVPAGALSFAHTRFPRSMAEV
ncbi:MAG TPA: YciI family protein [Candidatus Bathyarchaeia archaeon]